MLGDVFWKMESSEAARIMDMLNGKKYLIKGNHDQIVARRGVAEKFAAIYDRKSISVCTKDGVSHHVVMGHVPSFCYEGAHRGAIMLHGHVHNSEEHDLIQALTEQARLAGSPHNLFNVGCMHFGYGPATLDEIIEHYGGLK